MKRIVNLPNDTIAIVCEINDNKNNTYNIIPIEGAIGKIDEKGNFISEEKGNIIPSIEDYNAIEDKNNKYFYAFPKNIEQLTNEYGKSYDNLSLLVYIYLKDIASKLNILLKSDGKLHIYSKDYSSISKEIIGDTNKHYKELSEEVSIIMPDKEIIKADNINLGGLEKYLKERIFENDDIIEDIATTVAMNYTATKKGEVESILSIGPTGSGKTATFEAIAEYLNIPITIYDCNLITSAGYTGESIDDILRKIYFNSNEDLKIAERSILVLDEIDKLAMRGSDVKDAIVQYSFLKLIDGYNYNFEIKKNGPLKSIDTSFMTIACLGAFPEMYEAKKKEGAMGFNSSGKKFDTNSLAFTTDDIVNFGMLRELIGRINNIFTYKELSKDDLKRILTESKNSPLLLKIERYQREFNCLVEWEENFLDALVEEAYLQKSGGRSLSKVISKTFKKIDRELEYQKTSNFNSPVKKLHLTKETVENNRKFNI